MPALEQLKEVFGLSGLSLPGFGIIGTIILWIIGSVVIVALCSVIIWFIVKWYTFNQIIRVFGLVGGKPDEKYKTKGRFVSVGRAGDRVLVFKYPKGKTIANPKHQAGRNEWHFWERLDGELINVPLKNWEQFFKDRGDMYIDSDMRMERLAIEKNLAEMLGKPKFWEKYGAFIVNTIFIVLLAIMMIVLFMRLEKVAIILERTIDKTVTQQLTPTPTQSTPVIGSFLPLLLIKFMWRKKWHSL